MREGRGRRKSDQDKKQYPDRHIRSRIDVAFHDAPVYRNPHDRIVGQRHHNHAENNGDIHQFQWVESRQGEKNSDD
jgi:hypothetical protein